VLKGWEKSPEQKQNAGSSEVGKRPGWRGETEGHPGKGAEIPFVMGARNKGDRVFRVHGAEIGVNDHGPLSLFQVRGLNELSSG